MIRILGILAGSVLAVTALVMLVGIPEATTRPESGRVEVQLPIEAAHLSLRDENVAEAVPEQEPPPATPLPEVAPEELPPAVEPDEMPPAVVQEEISPDPVAGMPAPPVAAESEEQHWFAFWSPFRSRIAANGFVTQLQRVTGLDYRVVKVKRGVFEVAFAYSDDADIQATLSQISAATGLEMPES